jgi:hypothetical protein
MILIQSSASVFEILYDVLLLVLLLRVSFLYFALVFLTGCIFGFLRVKYLIPSFDIDSRTGELIEMPLMLLFIALWARVLIVRFKLPAVSSLRLIIGFMALGHMLVAELVTGIIMYKKGWKEALMRRDPAAGSAFATALALFGLMPWILMRLELRGKPRREAESGTEDSLPVEG